MIPSIVSISVRRYLYEKDSGPGATEDSGLFEFGEVVATIEKSGKSNGNRVAISIGQEKIETSLSRAKQLAEDLRLAITQAETEDLA